MEIKKTLCSLLAVGMLGCGTGCVKAEKEDYTANPMFALVNIGGSTGVNPSLVVDENRDGEPNFIASHAPGYIQLVYWVDNKDYVPKLGDYHITASTKVMTPEIRKYSKAALDNQQYLREAISHNQSKN